MSSYFVFQADIFKGHQNLQEGNYGDFIEDHKPKVSNIV